MIKPNPKNGTGSKLEPVLRIRYSEMAIPSLGPPIKNSGYVYNLEIAWKTFSKTFFFSENTCGFVLGLEHFCSLPREGLSSERLSLTLALASDFFCVLGLEPCVLDSTSDDLTYKKYIGKLTNLDALRRSPSNMSIVNQLLFNEMQSLVT